MELAMAEVRLSDLTKDQTRNLTGHERGLEARIFFDLDALDEVSEPVSIYVPETLDALTTSFFQGMFAKSLARFKSDSQFLEHYRFMASPVIMRQVSRGLSALRMNRSQLS